MEEHSRAMILIILDHNAVMLGARRPKMSTKRTMTALVVPKPQRKKHESADPRQQPRRT